MTKDELWEKYGNEVLFGADMQVSEDAFRAALTEYGQAVKREAVKVCKEASDLHHNGPEFMDGAEYCAADIEKMELP